MVTLTGPNALRDLQSRHLKRFADMSQKMRTEAARVKDELYQELVKMDTGSPQGPSRPGALRRADFPFARRHGMALWPTPPIGVITGTLLTSLSVDFAFSSDTYTLTGKSTAPYAQFVYSPTGTSKMVPRQFLVSLNIWAEGRMVQLGFDLMKHQLRLL